MSFSIRFSFQFTIDGGGTCASPSARFFSCWRAIFESLLSVTVQPMNGSTERSTAANTSALVFIMSSYLSRLRLLGCARVGETAAQVVGDVFRVPFGELVLDDVLEH